MKPPRCLFCDENGSLEEDISEQEEVIGELQDRQVLCTEYQLRQTRFVEILRTRNHVNSHHEKNTEELLRLKVLRHLIQDKAKSFANDMD